jgi:hypothetical protein
MSGLANYQRAFSDWLFKGDASELSNWVDQPERLVIYRNALIKNCVTTLSQCYQGFVELVSQEQAERLFKSFASTSLPKTGSLVHYGDEFPEWLLAKNLVDSPLTHSFAVLDRAYYRVLVAENNPMLDATKVNDLIASGEDPAQLELHVTAELLQLPNGHLKAWQNRRGSKNPETDGSEYVLLWRRDDQVYNELIPQQAFLFLSALRSQHTIAAALNDSTLGMDEQQLTTFFAWLLERQLLSLGATFQGENDDR